MQCKLILIFKAWGATNLKDQKTHSHFICLYILKNTYQPEKLLWRWVESMRQESVGGLGPNPCLIDSCVALGKLLPLSEPPFSHLKSEDWIER